MSDNKKPPQDALRYNGPGPLEMVTSATHEVVARRVATPDDELLARVLASTDGAIVAKMEELAAQHDIPLLQDAMLTSLLANVPSGDAIPKNVYLALSEVLAHIYRLGK